MGQTYLSGAASQLDDQLFHLHELSGANLYPESVASYLDDRAGDDRGWLRKYYAQGEDEPYCDMMKLPKCANAFCRWHRARGLLADFAPSIRAKSRAGQQMFGWRT
jgi:hypothetical protein